MPHMTGTPGTKKAQTLIRVRSVILGISLATLARELGITRTFLSEIVTGKRRTAYIRRHICARLGLSPRQLGWDEDEQAA